MGRKLFIVIFIFILAVLTGTALYAYRNLQPVDEAGKGENVLFKIENGESLFSVIERLEEAGLIPDGNFIKIYVKLLNTPMIKSGNYSVSSDMPPLAILNLFEQGIQELIKVTIPEGLTSRQIALILKDSGIISSEEDFLSLVQSHEFLESLGVVGSSLDGYLFPDTYRFQENFPPEKVLSHLVSTFFENLEEIYPYYKEFSDEKMKEKVILASIIEKEYRVEREAPLIASVFYNRLKIGMPLQSCATVIYVLTEELGKPHPDRIFLRDLEVQSPFNTYYNPSLPPAPIANPGYVAMNAAFNPAQTDYLFFVVENASQGTHTFTSNLSEHNQARQLYLEGFRSK